MPCGVGRRVELSKDFTPLEAGLYHAASVDKGEAGWRQQAWRWEDRPVRWATGGAVGPQWPAPACAHPTAFTAPHPRQAMRSTPMPIRSTHAVGRGGGLWCCMLCSRWPALPSATLDMPPWHRPATMIQSLGYIAAGVLACRPAWLRAGCYIGQEMLLNRTLQAAIKQQLWGLRLGYGAPSGAPLTGSGQRVGKL